MSPVNNKGWQFIILCQAVLWLPLQALAEQYDYEPDPVEHSLVEEASDLAALAEQAAEDGLVVMLMMSTDWCEYCEALEQQVLGPMLINGDFEGRALLRKVMVDDIGSIRNFEGERIETATFAVRQQVNLYPTLLFFDARGGDLVARIVGINVLEFAAERISRTLDAVRQRLQQIS